MKKQVAVIGLGRFGSSFALTLAKNGYDIIAIDSDEKPIADISREVTLAVQGDATDEEALKEAGVGNVDIAVISIGENIASSIIVATILKEMGIKRIIAKAINELHGRALTRIGIQEVVYPERDMAERVAHNIIRPEFFEHIELSPKYKIVELPAPEFLWGKTIIDSDLRRKFGITVIAIKRTVQINGNEEESWNINPLWSDVIEENDTLIVLGANEDIQKL